MIGTRIESRPASLVGPGLALLAAAGCVATMVVTGKLIWLCIAVLPLLIAGALWLGQPKRFAADVSATGLAMIESPAIEFADVECVVTQSIAGKSFPILLVGESQHTLIPQRLNVDSRELFEFLLEAVPVREKDPRDPDLAAYYERQQREFGEELVWHCAGRRSVRWPRGFLRTRLVCGACALAGLVYVTYGANAPRDEMMAIGGLLMLFGLIGLAIAYAGGGQRAALVKNSQSASLIVCPAGLALAQAEMKGELRWDEIRDIKLHDRGPRVTVGYERGTQRSGFRRLDLVVDGAVIFVHDIYQHPLHVIHQRIVALWK